MLEKYQEKGGVFIDFDAMKSMKTPFGKHENA